MTASTNQGKPEVMDTDPRLHAAKADPLGHRIHVLLFVACAMLIPIGQWPGGKDICLVGLIVLWILRITIDKGCHPWKGFWRDPLAWLILGWIGWSGLSILWSELPMFGLDQYKGLRFLLLPIMAWPVMHYWRWAIDGFALAGTCVAIVVILEGLGILESERGHYRAFGFMGYTGGILAATCMAHLGLTITRRHIGWTVWHLAALVLTIVALGFNGTRSAFIAVTASIPLIILATAVLLPAFRDRILVISTLCLILLAGIITLDELTGDVQLLQKVQNRIQDAVNERSHENDITNALAANQGSVTFRLNMWAAGRNAIEAKPLLGWGLGGVSSAMQDYPGLHLKDRINITDSQYCIHSVFLYQLITTGLIGFLLMVSVMMVSIVRLVCSIRIDPTQIVALGMLSAWLVYSTAETSILSGAGAGTLGLCLCVAISARNRRPSP